MTITASKAPSPVTIPAAACRRLKSRAYRDGSHHRSIDIVIAFIIQTMHLSNHFLSTSTPTILNMPKSLYAKQYLVGAHATTGHDPAVLKV